MTIVRNFDLKLYAGYSIPLVINVNQYDHGERWEFSLYNGDGTQYIPSSGAIVGIKSDGLGIVNTGTVEDGKVIIMETEQMTAAVGKAEFELMIDSQTHGTANFIVLVEKKPGDNASLSESDYSLLQEAIDSTSAEHIYEGVQQWMDDNLDTSSVVDKTLSISGAAADAKVTGDTIASVRSTAENALTIANGRALITANQDGSLAVNYAPMALADVPTLAYTGELSSLVTTNKASFVGSINEVYNRTRLFIESSEISEVLEG